MRGFVCTALCSLLSVSAAWASSEPLVFSPDLLLPTQTSFAYKARHATTTLPDRALQALWFSGADRDLPQAAVTEAIVVESAQTVRQAPSRNALCSHAAAVAAEHDLPVPFFANLIHQESGFKSHVVSPAGAQGIAQFMPRVARAYGLENPFDPIHSLSVSAKFLRELLGQFGNIGLAAAAYNAGPRRVQDWMAKRGKLPEETRNYVRNITGQPAERWARVHAKTEEARLPAHARCPGMPVIAVNVPENVPVKVVLIKVAKGKTKTATKIATKIAAVSKEASKTVASKTPAGKSYVLASTGGKKIVLTARSGNIRIMAPERGTKTAVAKKSGPLVIALKESTKPAKHAVKVAAKSDSKSATKTAAKTAAKPAAQLAAKSNDRPPIGKRVKVAAAR